MEILRPDLCVVGAGAGGLSVAAAAAALGVAVVLIEKGETGGDCLNHGCVPSKALIAAAARAQAMRESAPFGIAPEEPRIDFSAVMAHVAQVRAGIAPHDSEARFRALGVTVIRAAARFVDPRGMEAGGRRIEARRYVLATGSTPAVPPIPGLDLVHYLTNETIFDLQAPPPRLVVVGAGPIGLELAQAFNRLGVETIVVEAGKALGREDAELVAPVVARLRAEGVRLIEGVGVAEAQPVGGGARLILSDGEAIEAPALLIATGRKPVVEGLGLSAAGIAHDAGGIKVGRDLRTSNRRVYAIGDCNGGPQFTHVANHQAGLAIRATLLRLRIDFSAERMPRVTYTDPELVWVGLSEEEARAREPKLRVLRAGFAENDRARTERRASGHVKLLVDRGGRLLGAGLVGAGAGELAPLLVAAHAQRMTMRDIAGLALPYPTLAETIRAAAASDLARLAREPRTRRLIAFLRRFG